MTQTHKGRGAFSPKKKSKFGIKLPNKTSLKHEALYYQKVVDAFTTRKIEAILKEIETSQSLNVIGYYTRNEQINLTSAKRIERLDRFEDHPYFEIVHACHLNLSSYFSDLECEANFLLHLVTLKDANLLEVGIKFTFFKGCINEGSSPIKLLCPDLCEMIFDHINFEAILHGCLHYYKFG